MLKSFSGMRLNTAGVVIGWVGAFFAFICLVLISLAFGHLDGLVKHVEEKNTDLDAYTIRHVLLVMMVVKLTMIAINLTACALLVAGTKKECHLMLMPWLINNGIALAINSISFLSIIVGNIASGVAFIPKAMFLLAIISMQFYTFAAVYSLYKQLQSNRQQDTLINIQRVGSPPSYTKI